MREDARFEKFKSDCELYLERVLGKPMCPPENIYVVITSSCNLRCKFCNIWKTNLNLYLPTLFYKKLIEETAKMKISHIIFSGGEPLLRPDIFEIIDYAKVAGISQISLITNGTLIDEEMAKKIAASQVSHVTISIDGLEEANDYIRGKGSFKKAVNAIYLLKKQENCRFTIGINCVINNKNLEDIIPLVQMAKDFGCNIVVFQPMLSDNIDMHKRLLDDELWVKKERIPLLEKVIHSLIEMKKKDEFKNLIFVDEITLNKIKDYFTGDLKHNQLKCYDGYIRIVVNPAGGVWMCNSDYGDLNFESLIHAWNSKKAFQLRQKIKTCDEPCLQACVLRPDLDNLQIVTQNFITKLKLPNENEFIKKAIYFLNSKEKIIKAEKKRLSPFFNHDRNKELKITLDDISKCKKILTECIE